MSWTGNVVSGAPVPTYNPNVNIPQNTVIQQGYVPSAPQQSPAPQSTTMNYSSDVPTVRVMDNERLSMESRMRDLDELAVKNARLEEAEKTAPNQQMRLITRHEIRLNTLESLSLRHEHLEMIQNGCARMNSLDDRMIEDLKNDLWIQLKSRHDVEVQKVVMGLQDEVMDLRCRVAALQEKMVLINDDVVVEVEQPVLKKANSITFNIEETTEDNGEERDVEDIKSVVAQAIAKVEAGEA
jgi:hypothetical protein